MTIGVVINMEPSKYKYHGIQIYRVNVPGGSIWMFMFNGLTHVTASLFAAKNEINKLPLEENDNRLKYMDDWPTCTECGEKMLRGMTVEWVCPNCGAVIKKVVE